MNEVALTTFSSFDTGTHPSANAQPERFYHGFVLGMLVDLRDDYDLRSNEAAKRQIWEKKYDTELIEQGVKRENIRHC